MLISDLCRFKYFIYLKIIWTENQYFLYDWAAKSQIQLCNMDALRIVEPLIKDTYIS